MSQIVSILVPNYKTLALTKLCLRLLRKNTNLDQANIIVIDNDSQDASLHYLRTLTWIDLIERKAIKGETPGESHARALDMALQRVRTPYVLSIHTDTIVKHPKWLDFLLEKITQHPNIAGVGSWKLEFKSWWRRLLKQSERQMQLLWYQLVGKTKHGIQGVGKNYYYLRSHCALYRTDLLQQLNLHFADGSEVAGKYMHQQLVQSGYQMIFLSSFELINYIEHINHATSVLNPELSTRQKSITKGMHRIKRSLARIDADAILQDASLDL